jgi:2-dehydro-3-deoxy-D-arabinonate dehydratase
VYDADRPELFFKATPGRVVGPETDLAIRRDSLSSVPEPELTLLITPAGHITAYTIGNDMTARSLEGENLLYLPQAKIWDRCCALGPCLLVTNDPLPASTEITLLVERDGSVVFRGSTDLSQMKRQFTSLVSYLFRHNSFASGCFLLTGTGIVPPDSFCLTVGDLISISISGIGTLTNVVA